MWLSGLPKLQCALGLEMIMELFLLNLRTEAFLFNMLKYTRAILSNNSCMSAHIQELTPVHKMPSTEYPMLSHYDNVKHNRVDIPECVK